MGVCDKAEGAMGKAWGDDIGGWIVEWQGLRGQGSEDVAMGVGGVDVKWVIAVWLRCPGAARRGLCDDVVHRQVHTVRSLK